MYYKIAQLILTPGKKANSISDIYIAEPDLAKEAMIGKIFILAEIENNTADAIKLLTFIINNINRNYYQNERILLAEKITAIKPEHILEAALANTNKDLTEFMTDEKIRIKFNALNLTVGLIFENEIYFTNTGRNRVLFIYKHKKEGAVKTRAYKKSEFSDESSPEYEYKLADITRQTASPMDDYDETKLFTNVVSGRILESSCFIITNEALPEYISTKQLINISANLPPISVVEQFKMMLNEINTFISFLGIIIKSTTVEKEEEMKKFVLQTTEKSIINLNNTENVTEGLLSPSGIINFKKWLAWPLALIKKRDETPSNLNVTLSLKDKIFFKKKSSYIPTIRKILTTLKDVVIQIAIGFIKTIKSFKTKEDIKKAGLIIIYFFVSKIVAGWQTIKNLSRKNKIILAFSTACLILFLINLNMIKNRNVKQEKNNEWQSITSLIVQKQNQMDADLLYNNRDGAQKLFTEINALLAKYPQDNEQYQQQYEELKKKYDEQLNKIRKISKIDNTVMLVDFKNLVDTAQPANIILNSTAGKIYAGDSTQKSIYITDLKSNQIATIADLKMLIANIKLPVLSEDKFIYFYNEKSLLKLDLAKETLSNIPLTLPDNVTDFSGLGLYNGNLYAVAKTTGQIYKFDANGQVFSAPKKWLKDSTDIKDATAMAIDGNIFILKADGQLIKFLRGAKVDFKLDLVDPPLATTTAFYLSSGQNFIYLLEPSGRRIIVFNMAGQLVTQYYSEQYTDLKGLTVDEKNKIIYVLNGTQILSFKATHM